MTILETERLIIRVFEEADIDSLSAINRDPLVMKYFPSLEEIYETDDERKMTFDQSLQFGNNIRKIYEDLGYEIIDVPMESLNKRAKFIQNTISKEERHGN